MNRNISDGVMKAKLILIMCLFPLMIFAQKKTKIQSYHLYLGKEECKQWNYPTRKILKEIFDKMTPLEGPTHHCCYNNFSCTIDGKIIYKGKKYNYSVNAGGWAELSSITGHEWFYLACTYNKHFKYFISTYDTTGYGLNAKPYDDDCYANFYLSTLIKAQIHGGM